MGLLALIIRQRARPENPRDQKLLLWSRIPRRPRVTFATNLPASAPVRQSALRVCKIRKGFCPDINLIKYG